MAVDDFIELVVAVDGILQAQVQAEALVQFVGLPIFQHPDGLKAVRWLGS